MNPWHQTNLMMIWPRSNRFLIFKVPPVPMVNQSAMDRFCLSMSRQCGYLETFYLSCPREIDNITGMGNRQMYDNFYFTLTVTDWLTSLTL